MFGAATMAHLGGSGLVAAFRRASWRCGIRGPVAMRRLRAIACWCGVLGQLRFFSFPWWEPLLATWSWRVPGWTLPWWSWICSRNSGLDCRLDCVPASCSQGGGGISLCAIGPCAVPKRRVGALASIFHRAAWSRC